MQLSSNHLFHFNRDAYWRTNTTADWNIYIEDKGDSIFGQEKYVGLENPGASNIN